MQLSQISGKMRIPLQYVRESCTKVMENLLGGGDEFPKPVPAITEQIEQARREWLHAQNYYDSVSDEYLVDHAVYLLQAAEKKYMYLLKMARQQGITYSPYLPADSGEQNSHMTTH